MAKLLKLRRGTTTQHGSFTGAEGEVTIDTTKDTAVVHDGSTQGGTPLAKENMDNVSSTNIVTRISNSALAGVKVQPNFGTQDIETTGNIDLSDSTGSGNNRIKLGAGDDLEIYHDGSHSRIYNTTGYLKHRTATGYQWHNSGGTEILIEANVNGAVELYYDNSKKLETFSNGIKTTGSGEVQIRIGSTDAGGAGVYFDGDSNGDMSGNDYSYVRHDTSGRMRYHCDNPADIGVHYFSAAGGGNTDTCAYMTGGGSVELFYDGSKKLETRSWGVQYYGDLENNSDSSKIKFGVDDDLQIYHDGTHSRIVDNGANPTSFQTNVLRIHDNSGNFEYMAEFNANGAVELYYDNSLKFSTNSNGWKSNDSVKGHFGTDGDLQIYHSGSNSFIKKVAAGAGHLYLDSDGTGDVYLRAGDGGTSRNVSVRCYSNAGVDLRYQGTTKFETTSFGAQFTDNVKFDNPDTAGRDVLWAADQDLMRWQDNTKATFGNSDDLQIYHDGSYNYLLSPNAHPLLLEGDEIQLRAINNEKYLKGVANGAVTLYYDNSAKFLTTSSGATVNGALTVGNTTASDIYMTDTDETTRRLHCNTNRIGFLTSSNNWGAYCDNSGNWTATGNVTAYSDARLKTNVNTINDALSIVGKMRGVSFDWKETGKHSIGVIAQEVEEVIPELVVTTKGADPATGKTTEVKSVDYGKIVGVLINAINELKAEVDELKGGK